jgi:YVTN family beta-propeller protein
LYADGSTLWVSGGRGHVLKVRDRSVTRYPHPTGPLGITVVDGEVWTTASSEHRHADAAVVVLDSETGAVMRRVHLPGDSPYGIDHTGGNLFVALYDGELLRIDRTGDTVTRVRLGDGLTQVLATDEAVWVSQPGAGVVWRVAFEGGEAAAEPVTPGERGIRSCPQGSDAGRSFVLVADPCAGRVWLLDPRTGDVTGALSGAGERPADVAVDGGLIYVVSMPEDQVTVLDESTLDEVAVVRAGQGAISVAAAAGIAWVANMDDDTVTRIEVSCGSG